MRSIKADAAVSGMRIGELAAAAGVDVETIRYYERLGLLPAPPRRSNGYRTYARDHLERLAFIRHCRALGMSLADVQRLLDLLAHPEADCHDANCLIDAQLERVRERLQAMQMLERQLSALRTRCRSQHTADTCGILHELVAAAQGEGCICHPGGSAPTGAGD
ncbi:Cd(II)/Pb(II)-responsive transcriptional regulator [Thiocystis violascens]|uniref:Cd(II)/Pb(II)-responsive transcriptional regulator n=1 Tax=Thiocystis violascens (strain ATCC 17096 / DSM 198 / 6111) TaxID=765911 RepID=I3Y9E8_THIV6|nr:Cd(II)/Pb(II)-responsive transcriptional regulator [Thiocystis violascens]AFL73616.1 Cd(II)/Pb(II)-responsive transcriptional regulator [Thiocystis violascens DSM 198]